MTEDEDALEYFTQYRFSLQFSRIIMQHLIASSIKAKVEFATNPAATAEQVLLAWNKIEFWIENLHQCLMVSADNPLAVATAIDPETAECRFTNNLMLVPGEPSEEIIGHLLQSKFNALANDALFFGPIELESAEAGGIIVSVIGGGDSVLPPMSEWVSGPNWFKTPWWNRDDGSMIDSEPVPESDLTQRPAWAFDWSFLTDKPKPNGVVIPGRFQPKLVDTKED